VDNIAFSENYLSVVEETAGRLGEHNFKVSPKTPVLERTSLAPGYSMKLAHARSTASSFSTDVVGDAELPPQWIGIRSVPSYQTFPDEGMTLTFTSRGGPTWICGSFTLHNCTVGDRRHTSRAVILATPRDNRPFDRAKGFGFNCALQLNGSILNETLVGSGDPTNDFFDNEGNTNTNINPKGGGGIQGASTAVVVDAVIDLEPGTHTLRIAVQNILSSNGNDESEAAISSREIFALELTR
jgi:hypothetical protein